MRGKRTTTKHTKGTLEAIARKLKGKEQCMGRQRRTGDEEKGWPRNLYKRGDSWILDFYFRGERYTETLGPMSRTAAQEKRDKRRGDIAAGDLAVNGKVWRKKRWEQADE